MLIHKHTLTLFLTTLISSSPTMAAAAESVLEEILVTATKRGDVSLQDIPISVQAITGDYLSDLGALDFEDYYRLVPGLSVYDQGPGDKRYVIRGVNAIGAGTVGLYVDEVIITGENAQDGGGRQPDIKLFDIERVEILKGPQGTTFGSSSLSGTIRYITKKPELTEMSGYVMGGARFAKDTDDIGWRAEGYVNIPVVEDRFAIRVSAFYVDEDGYIDNMFQEDVNGDQTTAVRFSATWAISDNVDLDFMYMHQDAESDGPSYYNEVDYAGNPLPELEQGLVARAPFTDDMDLYNATLVYAEDYGSYTFAASGFERDTVFTRDSSQVFSTIANIFGFPGGPYTPRSPGFRSILTQPKEREVTTLEARFASSWDSSVQLLAGIFYQEEERNFHSTGLTVGTDGWVDLDAGGFFNDEGVLLDRAVDTQIDETALFGELSWDITDKTNLTGGLRWFDIESTEVNTVLVGSFGAPGSGVGPKNKFGEDDVIGRINLSHHFTDDFMSFLQISEGFRSGGTNDQAAADLVGATVPEGYGSDSLINYELGMKSAWKENRVIFNGAIYYIDWSDIQLQDQAISPVTGAGVPFTTNGGGAEIYGLELESFATPLEGLDLGVTFSWINAELSEDTLNGSGLKGDSMPYVPELSFAFQALYEFPISSTWTGAAGGNLVWVDERNSEFETNVAFNEEFDSYTLVNLNFSAEQGSWKAAMVINNLFDDDTVVDVFRIFPGLTVDGFLRNRPRSVLFTLAYQF